MKRATKTSTPTEKNYITPAGLKRLQGELHKLLHEERPRIVETVAWAAGNGDRSENGDYIYGKRRLREIDRRVRFLTKRIEIAEIVDPCEQRSEQVRFGATVAVEDDEGRERTYRIVGVDETDAKRGRISWTSPIGRALMRARAGDVVKVEAPGGESELEVIEVRYEQLD